MSANWTLVPRCFKCGDDSAESVEGARERACETCGNPTRRLERVRRAA